MLKPLRLIETHMECRALRDTLPVLTDLSRRAFTHGTLACGDKSLAARFYADVLGLEVYHANKQAMYLKAPGSQCYVVWITAFS
jgi:hypothetical protein